MARIDEIKEKLNNLRLFFSVGIASFIVLTGALINQERNDNIDIYFWVGSFVDFIIIIGLLFVLKSIKNNTKIIKDL